MKICTGTLKGDTTVYNVNKDAEEKIGKLYVLRGKDVIEVSELKAGEYRSSGKAYSDSDWRHHGSAHRTDRIPQASDFHSIYIYGLQGSK